MTVWIEKDKMLSGAPASNKSDVLAFNVGGEVAFAEIKINLYEVIIAMQNAGYTVGDRPDD